MSNQLNNSAATTLFTKRKHKAGNGHVTKLVHNYKFCTQGWNKLGYWLHPVHREDQVDRCASCNILRYFLLNGLPQLVLLHDPLLHHDHLEVDGHLDRLRIEAPLFCTVLHVVG